MKHLAPEFPDRHEVKYKFDDQSEMTLILENLEKVQMPGKPLRASDVPFKSVQHFNRKPENDEVEEFQNHLQYAKFLNWLNYRPSTSDIIEVEIAE